METAWIWLSDVCGAVKPNGHLCRKLRYGRTGLTPQLRIETQKDALYPPSSTMQGQSQGQNLSVFSCGSGAGDTVLPCVESIMLGLAHHEEAGKEQRDPTPVSVSQCDWGLGFPTTVVILCGSIALSIILRGPLRARDTCPVQHGVPSIWDRLDNPYLWVNEYLSIRMNKDITHLIKYFNVTSIYLLSSPRGP